MVGSEPINNHGRAPSAYKTRAGPFGRHRAKLCGLAGAAELGVKGRTRYKVGLSGKEGPRRKEKAGGQGQS